MTSTTPFSMESGYDTTSNRMTFSAASCPGDKTLSTGDIVSETGWNPCGGEASFRNGNLIGGDEASCYQR